MDVEKLLKLGAQMGLQGEELRSWVDQKMEEDDNRREKERLDRERDRENATEQMKLEREKIKEQTLLLERQMDLERLRLENPTHQPSAEPITNRDEGSSRNPPVKSPRLPCFDDSKDQIDSYLLRFERYAKVNKWDDSDWAIHLSALLRGKALEAYTRLDENDAKDYEKVKSLLMRTYNLTDDGYNSRFRKSRPEHGERMSQFKTRLVTYFDKWLELSGKDKSKAEDILDLVLKEQLMNVCNKDLQMFLRERKPKTSDELVDLAEKYVEAHGATNAYSKGPQPRNEQDIAAQRPSHTEPDVNPAKPPQQLVRCHKCAKLGHLARDCRSRPQVSAMRAEVVCTYCNRRGHRVEDCWKRKHINETFVKSQTVASMTTAPPCEAHEQLKMKCGCIVPMVSAVCTTPGHQASGMPVATGYLNGKKVTVMRDSGCSCVVVRKGLVQGNNNSDKRVLVYLANGSKVPATLAEAELDCPYYKGEVSAVELESPLYDVIIGNIPGAKCPGTPIEERPKEEEKAAETRAGSARKVKSLLTPSASNIGETVGELIGMQSQDSTLATCRRMAESGDSKHTGKNNKTWYAYQGNVLYRYFQSPAVNYGKVAKQLVLPVGLRAAVMKDAHEGTLAGHLTAKITSKRILDDYFWPNVWKDVRRFCQSCDQCQRLAPNGQFTDRTCSNDHTVGFKRSHQSYHANLTKRDHERECSSEAVEFLQCMVATVRREDDHENGETLQQ